MHSKFIIVILFSFIMVNTSCQTKKYTPLDYSENMVIFGSGGGFAGTVNEYCILQNGQCFFKKAGEKVFNEVSSIEDNKVNQVFDIYKTLSLQEIEIKAPGNMYYFVKFGKKEKMHEMLWGAYGQDPPQKLKSYYDFLNSLVNNQPTR